LGRSRDPSHTDYHVEDPVVLKECPSGFHKPVKDAKVRPAGEGGLDI